MPHFLYSITLYPLELAYKYLYLFLAGFTGSYGAALLCLSVVSSLIFSPLKQMAASLQAREALIRKILAPQLAAIKAQSRGAERQARISALYSRYAYHPLYSLRSSLGVMLQVPFLCAAYFMLSAFEPIRGRAFWILRDLGGPDGLLGGVNALPLLMTLFNIGAICTAHGFSRRDRLQALAVAGAFLLMLYSAPSALLVYWTGNNALMLLENLWRYTAGPAALRALRRFFPPAQGRSPRTGRIAAFLNVEQERPLCVWSVLAIGMVLVVLSPSAVYLTDPDFFTVPFREILIDLVPYLSLWIFACFVLRILLPRSLRPAMSFCFAVLALVALLNSTLFTWDYGALDETVLSGAENLDDTRYLLFDAVLLCLVLCAVWALYRFRQTRRLLFALRVATCALALSGGALLVTAGEGGPGVPAADARTGEGQGGGFYSFSKTQPNVAVFFFDMFTGGHVGEIFAADRELEKRFAGFTWYPDCIAVGAMTGASAPGIYGGPDFAPEAMNARPELTLRQKYSQAAAILPRHFGARGYDVGLLRLPYPLDAAAFRNAAGGYPVRIMDERFLDGLLPRWQDRIGMREGVPEPPRFSGFIFSLSLFKAAPHAFRKALYNEGNWLPGSVMGLFAGNVRRVLLESAAVGLLPELADAASASPTLKVIFNGLPHHSWHLPENSLIPVPDPYPDTEGHLETVDGLLPEHVYTERHTLALLADFLDWLRRNGMYDNTMVILVSDHCEADSRMLNAALGVDERGGRSRHMAANAYPGRPHALLMVKDFGDNAPFRQNGALMSILDVPALACRAIGGCPGLDLPDAGPDRVRVHHADIPWRQIEVPGKKMYDPGTTAVIRGSMFRKENWSVTKK